MTVEREVFDIINNYRMQNGRAPLQWDSGIGYLCYEHSRNIATGAVPFSHNGVDNRIDRFPFYSLHSAENIAWNVSNNPNLAQTIANQWINSQGHRNNILGNFNRSAVGAAYSSDGKAYFTQLFGYQE